jgi:hypothetical protein
VVLDEPLIGLDLKNQAAVLRTIERKRRERPLAVPLFSPPLPSPLPNKGQLIIITMDTKKRRNRPRCTHSHSSRAYSAPCANTLALVHAVPNHADKPVGTRSGARTFPCWQILWIATDIPPFQCGAADAVAYMDAARLDAPVATTVALGMQAPAPLRRYVQSCRALIKLDGRGRCALEQEYAQQKDAARS